MTPCSASRWSCPGARIAGWRSAPTSLALPRSTPVDGRGSLPRAGCWCGGARRGCDARGRFADDAPLSRFGARLAASYGELAAQIHAAVPAADPLASALGPRAPMDIDAALAALRDDPSVTAATIEAVARAMPWLAATPPATAVIHGDLHFHNLCLSADGTITGVFDLGDAGGDAPEADLQYAHSLGPRFVAVAVHAYRRPLDMNAIRRAHLRTALTHILWHGPGTPRHRSIVAWIEAAFAALAIGP
ncbi:MAG: aminoglycoside phosphotransferase family protein [Deltaproteobacteria bacterium]|nr:MAG: aminoglycoside phosphotransferase family protein [Deltaproteobacteria bacterium]